MKSFLKIISLFFIFYIFLWITRELSTDIPMEEYEIITELFNRGLNKSDSLGIDKLVIIDSTYTRYKLNENEIESIEKKFGFDIPEDVVQNFQMNNSKRYKINQFFDFEIHYILLGQNKFDEIFEKGVGLGWIEFDKRFPNSTGRIYLSRLGFSNNKNEALLYYDIRSGGLSGAGFFIYLKKENKKWQNIAWARMWVS